MLMGVLSVYCLCIKCVCGEAQKISVKTGGSQVKVDSGTSEACGYVNAYIMRVVSAL